MLNEMASSAQMSPVKFKSTFSAINGLNFSDYIYQKRMVHASVLLRETNQYIDEIAAEVGYKSSPSFAVQFKRYSGMAPGEFRK